MIAGQTEALQRQFERDGYTLIRGVLSPAECQALRERILAAFERLDTRLPGRVVRYLPTSLASDVEGAWEWLLREPVVETLRAILEPAYTLMPDLHIQRNMFGTNRVDVKGIPLPRRWGWHQDACSEGFRPLHLEPAYRVLKGGLYLQDNDPEFGGGIDVVPGSHRLPLRTGDARRDWNLRQLAGRLGVLWNAQRVPIRQGDAVFFHSFLWHSSTLSVRQRRRLTEAEQGLHMFQTPPEKTKLTLYVNVSRSAYADYFLRHCLGRAQAEHAEVSRPSGAGGELFFCDTLAFHATGALPPAVREAASRAGIRWGSLAGEVLREARRLRDEITATGRLWNYHPELDPARRTGAVVMSG
ncbi:MAG: phytanoyl-CoA dioxygenase family protein [Candidatus Omnitrophica bacterium]|nr:phytanoyl-CoA dioxygenase family protein [Candidatus Omnitrophota bacterium]